MFVVNEKDFEYRFGRKPEGMWLAETAVDDETLKLIQRFERIIYISCNPDTLHDNLQTLSQTHKISQFALFDQFPYTHHVESGVLLEKI